MAKSTGNVFPTEFAQKFAGKSAGKTKNSSNDWAYYKESWSWAWALAQASWGVAPPLVGSQDLIENDKPRLSTKFIIDKAVNTLHQYNLKKSLYHNFMQCLKRISFKISYLVNVLFFLQKLLYKLQLNKLILFTFIQIPFLYDSLNINILHIRQTHIKIL